MCGMPPAAPNAPAKSFLLLVHLQYNMTQHNAIFGARVTTICSTVHVQQRLGSVLRTSHQPHMTQIGPDYATKLFKHILQTHSRRGVSVHLVPIRSEDPAAWRRRLTQNVFGLDTGRNALERTQQAACLCRACCGRKTTHHSEASHCHDCRYR
jgi:hypothetical protein